MKYTVYLYVNKVTHTCLKFNLKRLIGKYLKTFKMRSKIWCIDYSKIRFDFLTKKKVTYF